MTICHICNKGDVCDWKYYEIKIMHDEYNYYLYNVCEPCRDRVHKFIDGLIEEAKE